MDKLILAVATAVYSDMIADYRGEFPAEGAGVTAVPGQIPGLDRFEEFGSTEEWLGYCEKMRGKISWFLTLRESDGKMIGAVCLRHSLEYDDDDEEFRSHIGYSVRPSERGKGYAKEQLRLCLEKARKLGLGRVRLICLDTNLGSSAVIRANGGVYVDTIYGEESGLSVERYDIVL